MVNFWFYLNMNKEKQNRSVASSVSISQLRREPMDVSALITSNTIYISVPYGNLVNFSSPLISSACLRRDAWLWERGFEVKEARLECTLFSLSFSCEEALKSQSLASAKLHRTSGQDEHQAKSYRRGKQTFCSVQRSHLQTGVWRKTHWRWIESGTMKTQTQSDVCPRVKQTWTEHDLASLGGERNKWQKQKKRERTERHFQRLVKPEVLHVSFSTNPFDPHPHPSLFWLGGPQLFSLYK